MSNNMDNEQSVLSPRTLTYLSTDPLVEFQTAASLNELNEQPAVEAPVDPTLQPSPSPAGAIPPGPSRKQNNSCDECRKRKVRCPRVSIETICANCNLKGLQCTSNYVLELQEKAKHARLSKENTNGSKVATNKRKRKAPNGEQHPPRTHIALAPESSNRTTLSSQDAELKYFYNPARPSTDLRPSEKQANCIRYLLSPRPITHNHLGYSDLSSMDQSEGNSDLWEEQGGRVWKEEPTDAHVGLSDVGMRALADDLVESFFTFANPRFPMLDPVAVRSRLISPDTHPEGPLPLNLLAVIIAFGARFSDNLVINADREECMGGDEAAYGAGQRPPRSRLVQLLVIRAREVVEVQKTHRIASITNVQVLVLLELMLGQSAFLRDRYQPYNFTSAIKLARQLGYANPKYLMSLQNGKKESAVYMWSIICVSDGYTCLFQRLQSTLSDLSDDILAPELTSVLARPSSQDPGSRITLWFSAVSTGSKMAREIATDLWSDKTTEQGISVDMLERCIGSFSTWRENHLATIRIPGNWPEAWNFESAITAVSTDAYYHNLWLVLERGVKEFGIKELRTSFTLDTYILQRIDSAKTRIRDEADRGAHRIATLTSILALNHYIRLDPYLLHSPIYEAGLYLAESGREECMAAIAGLRQHCISYPQFWSQAEEIERLYNARSLAGIPSTYTSAPVEPVFAIGTPALSSLTNMSAPYASGARNGKMGDGQGVEGDGESDVAMALFEWLHQV